MILDACNLLCPMCLTELLLRKMEELNLELTRVREENLHLLRRQAVSFVLTIVMNLESNFYAHDCYCVTVKDRLQSDWTAYVMMSSSIIHVLPR